MSFFDGCPGSKNIKEPFPEEITCPYCHDKLEIFSDEVSVVCKKCNKEIRRDMPPTCIDWCSMAKDCMGEEKYRRYIKNKEIEKPKKEE